MPGNDTLYGTGFAFPLLPLGSFAPVSGADAVAQAIRTILLTEPGERIGRPSYGCGLRRFLFAPNNVATRTLIQQAVTEAIDRDEPRLVLDRIEVLSAAEESTRLDIHIRYRLLDEHSPRSLVYPFYLATGVT